MNTTTQNTDEKYQHTKSKKSHKALLVLAGIFLLALSFASAYLWQKSVIGDQKAQIVSINTQVTSLQEQLAETKKQVKQTSGVSPAPVTTTAPTITTTDLIAGNTDTRRPDDRILIGAIFKNSLNPTELWVEYGTNPDNLDKATAKMTKGLGEGSPGSVYTTGFDASISNSDLQSGTGYYYRTAATVNGETVHSGIAYFVTDK